MQLKRSCIINDDLTEAISQQLSISYERSRVYQEIDRSLAHPIMAAALELYADVATTYSAMHNATVWVTSDSDKYAAELNNLLNRIDIEERIFDWAWSIAGFGDMFIQVNGQPGIGIVSIDDSLHPSMLSRIDYNGTLIGFYNTPSGHQVLSADGQGQKIIEPWQYVHFRLLGAKVKRPMTYDSTYSEFRTIHLMGPDVRQASAKYGTSLLINGLPIYKRLRLAEDSLLMSRLTRGILKYLYKFKVDSDNVEAVSEMVDELRTLLKRARAIDTKSDFFDEKFNPMAGCEDVFIPIWGDVNDLTVEPLGGEPDIKWIADIEDLRNQLACAVRVPLSLLGGFVQEASGQLGSEAIEKLDIRFARSARRLQRALKTGIARLCQIHLAYLGMDPDANLFEVNFSETSSAEELQLRESANVAVETMRNFLDLLSTVDPEGNPKNKADLVNFLNDRFLKLEDFDMTDYLTAETEKALPESRQLRQQKPKLTENKAAGDLTAYLPINEKVADSFNFRWTLANKSKWNELYGNTQVIEQKINNEK